MFFIFVKILLIIKLIIMRNLVIILLVFLAITKINGQDKVIVGWTFPDTYPTVVADTGTSSNMNKEIVASGTNAIEFGNGYTTKAAQTTGWQNGQDYKAWYIEVNTTGFDNITLSSRQKSVGNAPGPKNFKIQYWIGINGTVEDVPGAEIVVEDDWETSFLDNYPLPAECENKPRLFIMWIMTTNEASGGGPVLEDGISKIDEIFVRGNETNSIEESQLSKFVDIFPNPSSGIFNIKSEKNIEYISVYNINGAVVKQAGLNKKSYKVDISCLPKGNYMIGIKL